MDEKAVAKLMAKQLIARTDVKAIQRTNGAYNPIEEPWSMMDLTDHLAGHKTYGHYLLDTDSQCKIFAFDIDLEKEGSVNIGGKRFEVDPREVWAKDMPGKEELLVELRVLAEGLAERVARMYKIPAIVSFSGSKGFHVVGVIGSLVPAADARTLAVDLLESFHCFVKTRGSNFWEHEHSYGNTGIEIFPKQTTIEEGGFGNLMRLPLGIHRKSGSPGMFVDLKAPYDELVPDDPELVLTKGSVRR